MSPFFTVFLKGERPLRPSCHVECKIQEGSVLALVSTLLEGFSERVNLRAVVVRSRVEYDTVSDVVESKVHQCQQNSDA